MFDAPLVPTQPDECSALMQSAAFAAALRLCGRSPITLPSGHLVLSQRICGIPMLMLPRANPPPDLEDQLAALGMGHRPLVLSPEEPVPLPTALRLCAPSARYVMDLAPPEESRRAALQQKWRHQLGQAERSLLRVRDAPLAPEHPILLRAAVQARNRRYRDWPPGLTAAFAHVAADQTRLFTAYDHGTPVAAMLFLRHGDCATYHLGLLEAAGRGLNAHNLILWQAARWLAARGVRTLDLGLQMPQSPGIDRFKRRTGARLCPTGGTWLRWRPLARRSAP